GSENRPISVRLGTTSQGEDHSESMRALKWIVRAAREGAVSVSNPAGSLNKPEIIVEAEYHITQGCNVQGMKTEANGGK
ncbi:hypothetical protein AbraIFM66950_003683, partial [Aspergillus brasiliensis]